MDVTPSLPSEVATAQQVISQHAKKVIDFDRDVHLFVAREDIWRSAKPFYKTALHSPSRLRQNLCVQFEGEEGIDAGALKIDFFEHKIIIKN